MLKNALFFEMINNKKTGKIAAALGKIATGKIASSPVERPSCYSHNLLQLLP